MRLRGVMGLAAITGTVLAGALGWTVRQVQSRATGDIADFGAQPHRPSVPVTIVVGASIVRGRASVDFVEMLRERLPGHAIVNAGVNGNVAWEVLQRIDLVVACGPSHAVILVGTNDVLATLNATAGRSAQRSKSLPHVPTMGWYAECLAEVVAGLRGQGCMVALCSLPPIGQALQAPVNVRVREFNAAIREVARDGGAAYLPVYEALAEVLIRRGLDEGPAWTGSWRPGLLSLVRHFVFGTSYDAIAASRGWLLSPDGVHQDRLGASVIADVVEQWLSENQ